MPYWNNKDIIKNDSYFSSIKEDILLESLGMDLLQEDGVWDSIYSGLATIGTTTKDWIGSIENSLTDWINSLGTDPTNGKTKGYVEQFKDFFNANQGAIQGGMVIAGGYYLLKKFMARKDKKQPPTKEEINTANMIANNPNIMNTPQGKELARQMREVAKDVKSE